MGIDVVCENEVGGEERATVGDPHNLLHRLLPTLDDDSFHYLRFIDWYGDTVFNRMQIYQFLSEWQRLYPRSQSIDDTELLSAIEDLAKRCLEGPHLYLRFIGD